MPLEELHLALVLPGSLERGERAQVAALPGGILLARVEAVLSGFEFAYHARCDAATHGRVALETPFPGQATARFDSAGAGSVAQSRRCGNGIRNHGITPRERQKGDEK